MRRENAEPAGTSTDESTTISFDYRPVARVFYRVIPTITILGAAANYAIYNLVPSPDHPIADILKRFDLGHEPSIPAFYSAIVMILNAGMLAWIGRYASDLTNRNHWYVLSGLMIFLAIDEAVMFHEMGDAAMDGIFHETSFYFSWVIPGAIFATVIGLSFLRFLLRLDRPTCVTMILAGSVFLAGAIGMEIMAGVIFSHATSEEAAIGSLAHVIVQAIEEGLEMIGMAIFLCGLVRHVHLRHVLIRVQHADIS